MRCAYPKYLYTSKSRNNYVRSSKAIITKASNINCELQNKNTTDWNIHSYSTSRLHLPSSIIRAAIDTIEYNNNLVVVVNSFQGLESFMQEIINKAVSQDVIWKQKHNILYNTIYNFTSNILSKSSEEHNVLMKEIYNDFLKIKDILEALYTTKTSDTHMNNILLSYCDIWSANIFMLCCVQLQNKKPILANPINIKYIDTRDIITIEEYNKDIIINQQIETKLYKLLNNDATQNIIIVPGKVSKTLSGHINRLYYCEGNVSTNSYPWDSTAVILGNLLKTQSITLFTKNYGVYTANPLIVSNAKHIKYLSFEDIYNILRFSTSITSYTSSINVSSIMMMYNKNNLVIYIKGVYDENRLYSTVISPSNIVTQYDIKCINSTDDISIVNIYNKGNNYKQRSNISINLIGLILQSLHDHNIPIVMICNSFGTVSLSIAVHSIYIDKLKEILEKTLTVYTNSYQVTYINDCSIINVIGKFNTKTIYKSLAYNDKIISIGSSALTESDSVNGQYTSVIVKTKYVNETLINLHNELF